MAHYKTNALPAHSAESLYFTCDWFHSQWLCTEIRTCSENSEPLRDMPDLANVSFDQNVLPVICCVHVCVCASIVCSFH